MLPWTSTNDDAMPRTVIRRAVVTDAEAIHAMLAALARDIDAAHRMAASVDDIRRHGFGANPVFDALIAETDGQAVGLCLFFTSFSSWRGSTGVYVQDLYVAEEMRGTGLGRWLLEEVAALAAAQGGTYLRLAVDAANIDGQGFYERLGLSWCASERIFEIAGDAFAALGGEGNGDDAG
jgi:GNAT superfamily N-acetyltransferase